MKIFSTKIFYLSVAVIAFLIVIFIIIASITAQPEAPDEDMPEPTNTIIVPTRIIPPVINKAPTLPPSRGGGIDENSVFIQSSVNEIQKLNPHIPYSREFISSTGVEVSILIPKQELQSNKWTLAALITGINYNTSPDQADYQSMKKSFKEAADFVFAWIKENGADPNKIIFIWGDRKYIQNQAVNWLND